ncbi:hypothetical protein HELRODRAFT_172568 [Helobdella robusta]|uniref:DDE-1 domain-containing protein n=1 Tax=Helobdella robusta TaxID=6412 RepID=T1F5J1_HELRO|nr:hypothetical protein HELRODRAFT_172568 [Helobdella robusta]ESO04218.1 hypothetical protein HELRODRAFT_172568 [Helobdella robusta]
MPLKTAVKKYGVPARTLKRHQMAMTKFPGKIRLGHFHSIFTKDQELELVEIIKSMEKSLFGMTTTDVRKVAFEFAEKMKLSHPFKVEMKMAGIDWMYGFLKRHPTLSIRKPEAINLSRLVGFNKEQVKIFFDIYLETLNNGNYNAMKIWNVDETGISTVQKPVKIVGSKGSRQIGKITSGERGHTVTVLCSMNAAGIFIPPMFIFPRKRMVDSLMNDSPPQSIGTCTPSGWSDSECFMKWLRHFISIVKPSVNDKHLILLDGHHSHKTLESVMFAQENGIEMLTFPPHCTHKLQPLDKTFFKSLKSFYNSSADSWMMTNKGRRITFYEIATIFKTAYFKSVTIDKAVNGFASTGLWPPNMNVFSDEDFHPSNLTDEPLPSSALDLNLHSNSLIETIESVVEDDPNQSISSKSLLESIVGPIKSSTPRGRKRKSERATLLTSSPNKKLLQEKDDQNCKKIKRSKDLLDIKSKTVKRTKDTTPCGTCTQIFCKDVTGRQWIKCQKCGIWHHNGCQGLEEDYNDIFICIECDD